MVSGLVFGDAAPAHADMDSDPPAHVARLAQTTGVVSVRLGGQFPVWRPSTPNQPVVESDSLWAQPGATMVLQIDDVELAASGGTQIDVIGLAAAHSAGLVTEDDNRPVSAGIRLDILHGSIVLCVPQTHIGRIAIRTPAGGMMISGPGIYLVQNADQPTRSFAVVAGSATIAGDDYNATLAAGQSVAITGNGPFSAAPPAAITPNPALAALPHQDPAANFTLPPSLMAIPGLSSLAAAGEWRLNEDYSLLWLPHVASDWVPYRAGCWRWVRPWGWNWIARENWGFAPFHYGRWLHLAEGWAWQPPHTPFIFTPAVVGFFQPGKTAMGWVPLAPGETYAPPFYAGSDYTKSLNAPADPDKPAAKTIPARPILAQMANRDAATVISQAQLAASGCTDGTPPAPAPDGMLPLVPGRAILQPATNVFALPSPPAPGPVEAPISVHTARPIGGMRRH